jgi:uncharacterized RDD family membrane protein YckC
MNNDTELEYAGFWVRVGASIIDTLLLTLLTLPPLIAIYGMEYFTANSGYVQGWADFWISWMLPAVLVIALWQWKSATPGKMAISCIIVDAKTGSKPTIGQSILRYIGYFVSTIPLGLGLLWVGWDKRKQGWHDKIAGTVVIRSKRFGTAPVTFENNSENIS